MSELVVIGYENESQAETAREALFTMSKEYLVEVGDAVVAHANAEGKIKLNQMVNMWAAGASGGAFWGLLIGLLFLNPLLGVAVGASAGALSGALADYVLTHRFKPGANIVRMTHGRLDAKCRAGKSGRQFGT